MQRTAFVVLGLTVACGLVPERVSFDDSRVVELLSAANAINRESLGFTPIDPHAQFALESRPRAGYDAMLHVYGKTSRTIAFRRRDNSYEWIGEQESFEGPNEYDSPDGRFHEAITITFETAPISGVPLNKVALDYRGDDSLLVDLATRRELSLEDVNPVLVAWGYRR